jgi:hypothetical protein
VVPNSSIHFDNYNFRYFKTNKSSGDIVWRCVQKTCNVTIITNNEKTVLIRSNIKEYQHDEDNDEQKKELQKIRTASAGARGGQMGQMSRAPRFLIIILIP